jgi:hypothetical protein
MTSIFVTTPIAGGGSTFTGRESQQDHRVTVQGQNSLVAGLGPTLERYEYALWTWRKAHVMPQE